MEKLDFYINGAWVKPSRSKTLDVINPATEEPVAKISLGSEVDVNLAVSAAKSAFDSYSQTPVAQRIELLTTIREIYKRRIDDVADAIQTEMGAPTSLARGAQAMVGLGHLKAAIRSLSNHEFEFKHGEFLIRHEPIGVCGLITPWNWPVNQVVSKLAPCIAAGCTAVLKPSEIAPLSSMVIAEILHEANVPAGVFNLVNGLGPEVGEAMSSHPDIDMMSFTGSTRGGVAVAKASADSVKRVSQELGGKSANIVLDDADIEKAVSAGVSSCFLNTGQSCNAPTRMLVSSKNYDKAVEVAANTANAMKVGDPFDADTKMGPISNKTQYEKVQRMIQIGIDEGATLSAGGVGLPDGCESGYYVKPTIFSDVTNDMTIAREEIFGPVLCLIKYETEEEAIEIANDTPYGLAGYVQGEQAHAVEVASKIRAGQVTINKGARVRSAPFGGYGSSGNGREHGTHGLEECLETKAVIGALVE